MLAVFLLSACIFGLRDNPEMDEDTGGKRFMFSWKEGLALLAATGLALASLKTDDPAVVIPMLVVSAGSFVGLIVLHHGAALPRLLAAAGAVIVLSFVGWRSLRPSNSNKQAAQPHLSAELIFETNVRVGLSARAVVENIGDVTVRNLVIHVATENADGTFLSGSEHIDLIPRAKRDLALSPIMETKRPLSIVVIVIYDVLIRGESKPFHSNFRFLLDSKEPPVQPLFPVMIDEAAGDPLANRQPDNNSRGPLDDAVGTLVFVFDENETNHSPGPFELRAVHHFISIDPVARTITGRSDYAANGKPVVIDLPRNPNGQCTVGILWDDRRGRFGIDADGGPPHFPHR